MNWESAMCIGACICVWDYYARADWDLNIDTIDTPLNWYVPRLIIIMIIMIMSC